MAFDKSYSDRLFGGGFRRQWHLVRFRWLASEFRERHLGPGLRICELGCHDARTLEYIPEPAAYQGWDANWEGGLDIARRSYPGTQYVFTEIERPEQMSGAFDVAICMETLEHVRVADHDAYIAKLHEVTNDVCFITIPNESGVLLLLKWLLKKFLLREPDEYRLRHILRILRFGPASVRRKEGGHRGYDYRNTLNVVRSYFPVVQVRRLPLRFAPMTFCSGIAIVTRKHP